MKKIALFVLLLVAIGHTSFAQSLSFERGSVVQSGKVIAYFYIGNDRIHQYWGCSDSVIKWEPHLGMHKIATENGSVINAIPLKTKNQQNNLTIIFSKYITEDKLTVQQSFIKIFNYYQKFGNAPADWTVLLMREN